MSPPGRGTKGPALTLYYLLVYAAIGITLPFFPQYLKSLGLTGTEIGTLLAVSPALSLVAPPLWGQLADRTGRPGLVLSVVTGCATGAFGLFLWTRGFGAIFAVLVLYASFSAAISTLIDSMTLRHVAQQGGSYARIRLWGSIGFAAASLAFGRLVDAIDRRVVIAALSLMASGAVWTAVALGRARSEAQAGPRPDLSAARRLASSREVKLFLTAVALHWVACGPYHSALSIHVTALGLPTRVIGDAASVGVLSEIAIMAAWPRFGHRVRPQHLLFASFAASALRWAGVALTSSPTVLVLLGLLHGLTFGVFFLSAVAFMAERAGEALKATGQALFVAAAFGLGGLAGYLLTGVGLDVLPSSHAVFGIAAALELVPAFLILRLGANVRA